MTQFRFSANSTILQKNSGGAAENSEGAAEHIEWDKFAHEHVYGAQSAYG